MEETIRFEENISGEPKVGEEIAEEFQAEPQAEPQAKITGNDIAYVFANIFAPSPASDGKPLTLEEARERFIKDYTASVGPILDLIGFTDALGSFSPTIIPPWLRVCMGIGAMIVGGVFFHHKYKPEDKTAFKKETAKPRRSKRVSVLNQSQLGGIENIELP